LVASYGDQEPYSKIKKDIILGLIDGFIRNGQRKSGIQLGCGNGYETEQLALRLGHLTVVDGASEFVAKLAGKNMRRNVRFVCCLFEQLKERPELRKKGDYVFCNYVLEHIVDVQTVLRDIRSLLKPSGKLFVVVPNRYALSRQIANEMGLLPGLKQLTANDHKHGHRRTFSRRTLVSEIRRAGFTVVSSSGIVLKILADFQLNTLIKRGVLNESHFRALQQLSEKSGLAELADSVFVVAQR